MYRRCARLILVLAGLAACSPATPPLPAAAAAAGASEALGAGVIVSVRAVRVAVTPGAGVLASILTAVGAGSAAPPGGAPGGAAEFIVRLDTGQTLSVVQADEGRFRAGDHVGLVRQPRIRIAGALPGA